jgi:hypothetical protein
VSARHLNGQCLWSGGRRTPSGAALWSWLTPMAVLSCWPVVLGQVDGGDFAAVLVSEKAGVPDSFPEPQSHVTLV